MDEVSILWQKSINIISCIEAPDKSEHQGVWGNVLFVLQISIKATEYTILWDVIFNVNI